MESSLLMLLEILTARVPARSVGHVMMNLSGVGTLYGLLVQFDGMRTGKRTLCYTMEQLL